MKYEVTNLQFVEYLNEALLQDKISIKNGKVNGYFEGDEMYEEGEYLYYNTSKHYTSNINQIVISFDEEKFSIDPDYANHPVVNVTYIGALAFSKHYNFDIPTADEWEKAARGNTGYDYPWGDSISISNTNFWDSGDYNDNGTTPVGFYNGEKRFELQTIDSPSPFGCYDMSGNVYELTKDYTNIGSHLKIILGGSFYSRINSSELMVWYIRSQYPNQESGIVGFRCVKK